MTKDRPIAPASVAHYLQSKFEDALPAVRKAMERLARSMPPTALAAEALKLYQQLRSDVPARV